MPVGRDSSPGDLLDRGVDGVDEVFGFVGAGHFSSSFFFFSSVYTEYYGVVVSIKVWF